LALLMPGEQQIEFWKQKQGELRRAFSVDITGVNERVVSLAVAPEAKAAFLTTQGRQSGTLWLLEEGREPRMLLPLLRAGEVQVYGDAAYVADRGRNEVLRYSGWNAMPRLDLLVTAGHGLDDPVGLALLAEQKKLVVASAGSSELLVLDLRSNRLDPPVRLEAPPAQGEYTFNIRLA
jgi:DNA-binding beta-propeller fold protein YncE